MSGLALTLPPELVDELTQLVAERLTRKAPAEDGWLRGAERIASYIDAPTSRVYALNSAGRIPVHHDGSALVARRSELDAWMLDGGGKRP